MSRFGGEPLGRLGLLRPTLNAKTRQSCARNCCSLCRNRTAHEGGDKRECCKSGCLRLIHDAGSISHEESSRSSRTTRWTSPIHLIAAVCVDLMMKLVKPRPSWRRHATNWRTINAWCMHGHARAYPLNKH